MQNKVLIRLENLADLFDGAPQETAYFQLENYAKALWIQANPHLAQTINMTITERTLGNSMNYDDWRAQKINWLSEDDD